MSRKELPIDLMMKTVEWEIDSNYKKSNDGIPSATHSGTLYLDGIAIRCYKLDNGKSVMNGEDIEALLKMDE